MSHDISISNPASNKYTHKKITKFSEVNLSAFIYRQFHEDFFSIVGTNTLAYFNHVFTCSIYTYLVGSGGKYR